MFWIPVKGKAWETWSCIYIISSVFAKCQTNLKNELLQHRMIKVILIHSNVKKGVALFRNGQCEKSCEIKGAAKKWLWWYRLMARILITTIQDNLCPYPKGISTKFTWIVAIKIFAINLYYHSHFLATPFISQLFHTGHFEQGHTFFYSQAVFEWISHLFVNYITWIVFLCCRKKKACKQMWR